MWEGRRTIRAGRFSALDRQSWIVFSVITTVLGVLRIVSELRPVVTPEPMAIFWNAGLAIGLLIVGFQATRCLTGGGIALFASAVAASFYPHIEYLCLAAGILGGMVIPGLILAVQRARPTAVVSLEVLPWRQDEMSLRWTSQSLDRNSAGLRADHVERVRLAAASLRASGTGLNEDRPNIRRSQSASGSPAAVADVKMSG